MIYRGIAVLFTVMLGAALMLNSCDNISSPELEESLEVVPNVTLIDGAENTSIRVNRGTNSYFDVDISNVGWNTLISNGKRGAWCLSWNDPINSNDATYDGVGVYSTRGDDRFDMVNRLFTMKSEITRNDPGITWREIQVAIWALLDYPKFDMNAVSELPRDFRTDGQANFDKQRVDYIVQTVSSGGTSMQRSLDGNDLKKKTICILATDDDIQTIGVPCDETAFAYGGAEGPDFDEPANDPPAHCFPEQGDLTENRWGWTNGGYGPGTHFLDLYSGAGQCVLSKGSLVGEVEVNIVRNGRDRHVTVIFRAADGHAFNFLEDDDRFEVHLYVGFDKYPPSGNVAPGQYPNNNDFVEASETEVTFEVELEGNGDIFVIAHAIMAGELAHKEDD
jgi:hypothetical protein